MSHKSGVLRDPDDTCPSCGKWTNQGKEKLAIRAREHPIHKTNFARPLSQVVNDIRDQLVDARGHLNDVKFAFPAWGESTERVEGTMTVCISYLYTLIEDIQRAEQKYGKSAYALVEDN